MSSSTVLSLISRKGCAAAAAATRSRASPNIFGGNYGFCRRIYSVSGKGDTAPSSEQQISHSRISSPWLMLSPEFGGNDMTYKFYSLADEKVLSFTKSENGDRKDTIHKYYKYYDTTKKCRYDDYDDDMPDHDADFVGSSHGWLAFFNRSDRKVFLSNPISRRHIKLPSVGTLAIPECNFKCNHACIKNVIISCPPSQEEDAEEKTKKMTDDECRAMMIYGPQERLAFCSPGSSLEWTPIGTVYRYINSENNRVPRRYESLVYSSRQKLFFSVTMLVELEAWDLSDPKSPRRIDMDDVVVEDGKSYLVYREADTKGIDRRLSLVIAEHSDELFLVSQFVMERMGPDGLHVEPIYYGPMTGYSKDDLPYKTVGFDVHKYDPVDRVFKYLDTGRDGGHKYDPELKAFKYTGSGSGSGSSLDGLAFFVGANQGFAIRTDEYPGLKPNSIYFTDKEYISLGNDDAFGGHDLGIFSYEDGTFSPCYYPCDYGSIQRFRPPPMWFTPSPPPPL